MINKSPCYIILWSVKPSISFEVPILKNIPDAQSDLMFVLSYLDPVFNHADNLKTMLAGQLQVITNTMNDFGTRSTFMRLPLSYRSQQGTSASSYSC